MLGDVSAEAEGADSMAGSRWPDLNTVRMPTRPRTSARHRGLLLLFAIHMNLH